MRRRRRGSASSWPRPGRRWCGSRSTRPRRRAAVPEIKQRMLDAGCDGAAHRRLPLQRPPAADATSRTPRARSTSTGSIRATSARASGATSSSRRSARSRSSTRSRCASASTAARSIRSWSWRRCRRTPTARSGTRRKRSSTSAWCCRRCSPPSSRSSPDCATDQIIISCKVSRPRDLIAVYRDLATQDEPAAAPRSHRSRHGRQGHRVVGVGAGDSAERRASATRFASRSRRGPAAIVAKRSTPRARSCRRSACDRSRRRSPRAPAAAARRRRRSRNWPSACRTTCAR